MNPNADPDERPGSAGADGQPVFVRSLAVADPTDEYASGVDVTRVHRSAAAGIVVQRLAVGARIHQHHHRAMWDHFIGLEGDGVVLAELADGPTEFRIHPGSFLAIPPATQHAVLNADDTDDFVFLLFQAPWTDHDFVTDDTGGQQP